VLATENPIEYEGTFPLPEAQLDRFLIRLSLGYPTHQGEVEILQRQHTMHPLERLEQVVEVEELIDAQRMAKEVHVDDSLKEYIVSITEATREHDDVYLGAGPRGSLALYNTTRAWAAMNGRDYVIPDDIKELAEAALSHRIIVSPSARMKNVDSRIIVREILASVPVPGARSAVSGAPRGQAQGWREIGQRP
jgi:MoxR-like ATPase